MLRLLTRLTLATLFAGTATSSFADNWPAWRGPEGNGVSQEKNLPTEWSPTRNVAWKIALPGPAGAQRLSSGMTISSDVSQ